TYVGCLSQSGVRMNEHKSVGLLFPSIVCLLLFPFLCSSAVALDPNKSLSQYVQTVWKTNEGLPHNLLLSSAQTRDGYMWFGTQIGLVRFDGVRFTLFNAKNTDQIKSNFITCLYADSSGTL